MGSILQLLLCSPFPGKDQVIARASPVLVLLRGGAWATAKRLLQLSLLRALRQGKAKGFQEKGAHVVCFSKYKNGVVVQEMPMLFTTERAFKYSIPTSPHLSIYTLSQPATVLCIYVSILTHGSVCPPTPPHPWG